MMQFSFQHIGGRTSQSLAPGTAAEVCLWVTLSATGLQSLLVSCSIKKTLTSSQIKFLIVNEKQNTLQMNVKIKCH